MNVVKEINKINQAELDLGLSGASWHDEYKDSAYIFVGGLHFDLTEGDVITIFSQYGEVLDLNMPRDKETGKRKGFAFLMYEDQRSTILAVDNLNGAKVLEKTLRVDHVKNYKQPKIKNEEGEWVDPEDQSLNAKPEMIIGKCPHDASTGASIDPEDPMRDYLIAQRREQKALKKAKKSKGKGKDKGKHKDETPEERRARKARKKEKKAKKIKSVGMKAVEDLLNTLGRPPPPPPHPDSPRSDNRRERHRRYSPDRSRTRRSLSRSVSPRRRSRSPDRERSYNDDRHRPRDSRYMDDDRDERQSYGHHSQGRNSRA
ncbi:hypothetical protein BDN70DRAFT_913533 [Pholiota conissans]|uniref:RRM domain-containing protein n=1 Tax=Pholiota conissans TaxID=109636 RepID=A0A9P5Z1Q8_9AGAR|nr:hypothetical protein BDN70DRAFT_913533 [Pholiota conissans]